jgi:hypothetical protein
MARLAVAGRALRLVCFVSLAAACNRPPDFPPSTARVISGAVSGAVVSGVTVSITGARAASVVTDPSGGYSFGGLGDGNYTVTPSLAGYVFSPAAIAVTVNDADVGGLNMVAQASTEPSHSISGAVSGAVSEGVSITLAGDNTASTTTNPSGGFVFTGLRNGSYTVSASLPGYSFTPPSTSVVLNGADVADVSFVAGASASPTYSISGTLSGVAFSAVPVNLTGASIAATSTLTDPSGHYTFGGLASGSYSVAPLPGTGYSFTPASRSVEVSGASVAGVDFVSAADSGDPCVFRPKVDYGAGSQPYHVIVGELDGDGRQDLAVANYGGSVSVLLGNGDGTFRSHVDYTVTSVTLSVAAGDFNQDGRADLVAVSSSASIVTVLLGNVNGTFPAQNSTYATAQYPFSVAAGDVTADGVLDLVVTYSQGVSVLRGNGDGTFQTHQDHLMNLSTRGVALGNFDGSSTLDAAVVSQWGDIVSVLLGNGDGTFHDATPRDYQTGSYPLLAAQGDFDADGRLDLATANGNANSATVLLGNGDGSFSATGSFTSGPNTGPFAVAVADVDGDGNADLVTANHGTNSVSVLQGGGDGTFRSPVLCDAGTSPYSVAIGDFNADGRPDLAVANNGSNTVSVLLHQ